MPGIMLTVRGKAIEGGAEGDVISVLNEQSKRRAARRRGRARPRRRQHAAARGSPPTSPPSRGDPLSRLRVRMQ